SLCWLGVAVMPLLLHPGPLEWSYHLAHPVHDLQSRVHRPAALRLARSLDVPRSGTQCPIRHARWSQFGAVCSDRASLAHGPLPAGLWLGRQSLVTVLTRCGLPLPAYFLADEKHRHRLTNHVYLATI